MRWTFDSGWSVVASWTDRCLAKVDADRVLSFQVVVLHENEPVKVLPTDRDYVMAYVTPEQLTKIIYAASIAFPGQLGEVFIAEDLQDLTKPLL
jgi:hypothetical protein